MSLKEKIDRTQLPDHIAIIMDGNGRWAQKKGMDRFYGHQEGVVSVRKIVEAAGELGIRFLTVYTFSTENWNRPKEEVDALMGLIVTAIQNETPDLMKNNVRLSVIGNMNQIPTLTRKKLEDCINETALNTGLNLILALSYSARCELTNALTRICKEIKDEKIDLETVDERVISSFLNTNNIPDPDLLIRTGGEKRMSNFLLWQLAYAELYFTDIFWPEFREENLYEAIIDYQMRERRFGKTSEQLHC
jgi:undecaprenyl diphosphate synthase